MEKVNTNIKFLTQGGQTNSSSQVRRKAGVTPCVKKSSERDKGMEHPSSLIQPMPMNVVLDVTDDPKGNSFIPGYERQVGTK